MSGRFLATRLWFVMAIVACVGVLSACTSVPTQQMEWDNPCASFHKDIVSGVDPEVLHARYGLNPNATVPGLGDLVGFDCLAGSDSGLEAITVRRRVGQDVYLDYIIADGGAAFDWTDWFAATRPELEMRPFEYGWTSEPQGLSSGLPDRPVWESLAAVVEE